MKRSIDVVTRHRRVLWSRFALRALVVTAAIAIGALLFRSLDLDPNLSHLDVRILTGSPEGNYHAMVSALAAVAAEERAGITSVESQGSLENLARLAAARRRCDVQLALVQDGFDPAMYQDLELIGRVGRSEAVVLLGRNADAISRVSQLQGLRIGVGPEGSGSAFVAQRLLSGGELAGLALRLEHHPLRRQMELAASGALDLAFFVLDEDAELLRDAVRRQGLQILGLAQTAALARRIPFVHYGTLYAGQYDTVRELPPVDKPILRLDTLLLSNGCAPHSDIVGLMTLLARTNPDFIDKNKSMPVPAGLTLSESALGFYENNGAAFTDEYVPWLVDIMPPSNWVYTIMAVSLFFNLAGFWNSQRLALIDLNRVALESDIAELFGERMTNEEIRHFDPSTTSRAFDVDELAKIIGAYKRHMDKVRNQSLSVLSPMGEEMGYRDQEIIMMATLDALRELYARLTGTKAPRP